MNGRVIGAALVCVAVALGLGTWLWPEDPGNKAPSIAEEAEEPANSEVETAPTAPKQDFGLLRGRVWQQGVGAVVGANVTLAGVATTTGEAGVFTVAHPGPGVFDVSATAEGLVFGRAGGCCESVVVAPPEKTKLLTLTLHAPGTVSGTVVSAGRAVPNASLTIHYRLVRGLTRSLQKVAVKHDVLTDDNGRFVMRGLAAGRLRVEAEGIGRKALGDVVDLRPSGHVQAYLIDIKAVASLSGRVQSKAGGHVAGATVEVGDGETSWRVDCEADGTFKLVGVPPGTWSIRANAPGFEPSSENGIAFHPHAAVSRTIRLAPINGVVGRVTTEDGTGVVGATVAVKRGDSMEWVRTQTDGRFRYGEAADDVRDAVLTAVHPQYTPSESTAAQPGTDMVLVLRAGGHISGLVSTQDGTPEPAANVALIGRKVVGPDPHGQPMGREVTARVDGTFLIGPLRPGKYDILGRVKAKNPGVLRGIDVRAGATAEVILHMDGGSTLTVEVVGGDGAPLAEAKATVFAQIGGEDSVRSATSDDGGNVSFDKLPPGAARVRVTAKSHFAEVLPVAMPERGEKSIRVALRAATSANETSAEVNRIGAKLVETAAGIAIIGLLDTGAAAKAGIEDGDVVRSVDFVRTDEKTLKELAASINSAPPTQLTIEVRGVDGTVRSVYLDL